MLKCYILRVVLSFSIKLKYKALLSIQVNVCKSLMSNSDHSLYFLQNEGSILIAKRNEVQQKLFVAVDVFILEVDELPLEKRLKTLQVWN